MMFNYSVNSLLDNNNSFMNNWCRLKIWFENFLFIIIKLNMNLCSSTSISKDPILKQRCSVN